jgi:hypothetical protein
MDRVIHKFKLKYNLVIQTVLVEGHSAKTRHIGVQDGEVYAWIEYTPDPIKQIRKYYRMLFTGRHFDTGENLVYNTTLIDEESGLVWHVFEV